VKFFAALACVFLAGGCASVIDVDRYHFDVDPCAPRPRECEGSGSSYSFLIVDSDIVRRDAEDHLDGFNFDGTDQSICSQRDSVSPSGETGIDNQMTDLLVSYEQLARVDVHAVTRMNFLNGQGLRVIRILDVDDLTNDDCVRLEQRPAIVPAGTILDADGDGEVDVGLTLDYRIPTSQSDETACIVDGVLHARFPPGAGALPFGTGEFTQSHGRARISIASDRIGGMFGAAASVADIQTSFVEIAGLVALLDRYADLDPTTNFNTDCISISFELVFDAVPVELGTLVTP
jgi:hypothetical protein